MAKKPTPKTACERCRFALATDPKKLPGEYVCRRLPPQNPTLNITQFPSVKADWWCGEFRSRA